MAIYDFHCTKCKSEFSLEAKSDQEIRDVICVDCRADREDLRVDAFDRDADGEELLTRLFGRISVLEKSVRRIDRELTRICGSGIGQKRQGKLAS